MSQGPLVITYHPGSLYLCVPGDWKKKEIINFATNQYKEKSPWKITKNGDERLGGIRSESDCPDVWSRKGYKHIKLHT